jgi:hypothetical protein
MRLLSTGSAKKKMQNILPILIDARESKVGSLKFNQCN